MSAFADSKNDFLREACRGGWANPQDASAIWHETVPAHILIRWLKQLGSLVEVDPASPRRLLNHFMLGADPEFCFTSTSDSERMSAQALGMKAAMAWGADNNGRLAEIRPAPARSALSVAASIWSTLYWMGQMTPQTLDFTWRSGGYIAGDGVGGHIHFGRKRPTAERETKALDTLAFYLYHANIFNQAEGRERIRRTQGHGNYGRLGDRRPQVHGWEYRTLPSWLDSPWLAYFVLTLGKLVVFDPEFIPSLAVGMDTQSAASVRAKLRGIFAYFKGRDDDAAFAHQILIRHGFPHFETTDFKPRWGIYPGLRPAKPLGFTYPTMIPANSQTLRELAEALLIGHTPEWPDTPPTWQPQTLPAGYHQVIHNVETYHHPGIGELVRDLVGHGEHPVRFGFSGSHQIDVPSTPFPPALGSIYAWKTRMSKCYRNIDIHIYAPDSRDPKIFLVGEHGTNALQRREAIAFLTSGWLPLWHIRDVIPESFSIWRKLQMVPAPKPPKPPRPASVALYPSAAKVEPSQKKSLLTPIVYQYVTTASGVTQVMGIPERWEAQLSTPTTENSMRDVAIRQQPGQVFWDLPTSNPWRAEPTNRRDPRPTRSRNPDDESLG